MKINNIEIYSTYNEAKYDSTISKNVYFDVLDDIVDKYNNTVHKTIKMKPIDATDDSYAEYNEDFNKRSFCY